jgi:hypothetical protein
MRKSCSALALKVLVNLTPRALLKQSIKSHMQILGSVYMGSIILEPVTFNVLALAPWAAQKQIKKFLFVAALPKQPRHVQPLFQSPNFKPMTLPV